MTTNNIVENKTIAEQTIHMKGIALSTSNLISQIPEGERAIEEIQKATVAVDCSGDLTLAVPENERAESGEQAELDELEKIRKLRCFAPAVGMRNILNALFVQQSAHNLLTMMA